MWAQTTSIYKTASRVSSFRVHHPDPAATHATSGQRSQPHPLIITNSHGLGPYLGSCAPVPPMLLRAVAGQACSSVRLLHAAAAVSTPPRHGRQPGSPHHPSLRRRRTRAAPAPLCCHRTTAVESNPPCSSAPPPNQHRPASPRVPLGRSALGPQAPGHRSPPPPPGSGLRPESI